MFHQINHGFSCYRVAKKPDNWGYGNFEASKTDGGGWLFKMTKPGNVPGSYAEYYKEVNLSGKTTSAYKLTFDPQGNLVHRKDKM